MVVVAILDALGQDVAAVELRREPRAERGGLLGGVRCDAANGLGRRRGRAGLRVGEPLPEEPRALRDRLRVRDHHADIAEPQAGPRHQAVAHRPHHLGHDSHVLGLAGEGVERRGHGTLERVLDWHHGLLHGSVLHGHDGLVLARVRDLFDLAGVRR